MVPNYLKCTWKCLDRVPGNVFSYQNVVRFFYCRRNSALRGPLTELVGSIEDFFQNVRASFRRQNHSRRRRRRLVHARKVYGDGARVHPYLPADYVLFELDFDCHTAAEGAPRRNYNHTLVAKRDNTKLAGLMYFISTAVTPFGFSPSYQTPAAAWAIDKANTAGCYDVARGLLSVTRARVLF